MHNSAAGTMPMTTRSSPTVTSATAHSHGRSGLANSWPRLRDHISSRNDTATPTLPRNKTSHSSTAAISTPNACATKVELVTRNCDSSPQVSICITGQ
jgi:hypothetical protein